MLYNSKKYKCCESKQLEDDFTNFPALTPVGYKFAGGPFTSGKQLNHPKMCENQKIYQ